MDFNYYSAVIFFFLVISFNVSQIQTSETSQNEYKARIIGGTVVSSIKDYAYNVYILTRKDDGSGKGICCGGSIIGVKWILTAGHCLPSDISVQNMKVFVGSKQRTNGKQYDVKRAIKHFKYQHIFDQSTGESVYVYDYMILELSQNLKYSKKVKKIDIGSNADIVTGQKAILTGYGSTSKESGPGTCSNDVLYKGEFIISSTLDCHRIVRIVEINEFCARTQGSYALRGYSGSPLVTKSGSKLIGVMSRGVHALDGQHSDVYCSVPYVKAWINKTLGA